MSSETTTTREHAGGPVESGVDIFEAHYAGRPGAGWEIDRPQPRFTALAEQGRLPGPVLDVGCGSGDNAVMVAQHGLESVGVDAAPTGLELGRAKARAAGVDVTFVEADALDLGCLGRSFRTVLDCGLMHCFDPVDRPALADSLHRVLEPGGRYFVLGWSDLQPGEWGPRRLSPDGIRADFSRGWRVHALERTTFDVAFGDGSVLAVYAEVERL